MVGARPGRSLRHSLWKAWRRVVRDVAAEAAEKERLAQARAEAPRRPTYPSKTSPDWRPDPVVPPPPPHWHTRTPAAVPATGVLLLATTQPASLPATTQPASRSTAPPATATDPLAPGTASEPAAMTLRPLVRGLPPPDETPEETAERVRQVLAKANAQMKAIDDRKFGW